MQEDTTLSETAVSPESVEQPDQAALRALRAYLRPELDWRGFLGIGLLAAAAVLVWRRP